MATRKKKDDPGLCCANCAHRVVVDLHQDIAECWQAPLVWIVDNEGVGKWGRPPAPPTYRCWHHVIKFSS
jgi:hypothetical protein